ncbi:sarcosine oxidase subunit gamma [Nissabacter sp. SGAir0207]|uniref:sarcosine oxidase subunit gamma n=1 Tax=Nissabacter sp. SGAir0207 TaxID=2126321 RepID=UPI0010CD091C|nr:sarcosine oxidase [Nissabacter sp. SGAir0207]
MQAQPSYPLAHLTAGVSPLTAGHALVTLVDCSPRARVGFRGREAAQWLAGRGYQLPTAPNQALWQADGTLVARLSQTEYLLLAPEAAGGDRLWREEAAWQLDDTACYLLPRQDSHAWLALSGEAAALVMAKLCGVDLTERAFAPGAIAQTSVARASAMVINATRQAQPTFWLLMDSATAAYFWPVLTDAMAEFDDAHHSR